MITCNPLSHRYFWKCDHKKIGTKKAPQFPCNRRHKSIEKELYFVNLALKRLDFVKFSKGHENGRNLYR